MISAVVLAAGEGKRMKSDKIKVVHKALGKELIQWVMAAAKGAGVQDICVVVGSKEEQVRQVLGEDVTYARQAEQKGTGHAVQMAEDFLKAHKGTVMLLCGDVPLVTAQSLQGLLEKHQTEGNACTVMTAIVENPKGYGRIARDAEGVFTEIVEHRDCTTEQLKIKECNAGMYCVETEELLEALHKLTCDNDQKEYYLTDITKLLRQAGKKVDTYVLEDAREMQGVNDRVQLAQVTEILRDRYVKKQMAEGVTFLKPDSCFVSPDAVIGQDTVIYPNCIIEGKTMIGKDCVIGPDCRFVDATIGNGTEIQKSVILESIIGNGVKIGPFAYIRPGNEIGDRVKIGDFVELKKAKIASGTKVPHLTYLGDATIGEDCNFACGVVTANYDGSNKFQTQIGDRCFVGCNVNLVAPVTVEDDAYIAAGSTITDTVPEKAMAIARARQVNKEGWVAVKGKYKRKK